MKQKKLRILLDAFQARLSRQITIWVFISLLVIEGVILIPSYVRREQELLLQLEQISSFTLDSLVILTQQEMSNHQVFQRRIQNIIKDSPIVLGIAIYQSNGKLMETFGEMPEIAFDYLQNHKIFHQRSPDGTRYDVAWTNKHLGGDLILIVRHDASSVQPELYAYIKRIGVLVLIISAFVTFVTIIVLGSVVISPILRLRDDLISAADALSKDETKSDFYSFSIHRNDELGEVMNAFNFMFHRVYQEISQRKQAEAILRSEQETSERLLLNILPEAIALRLKQGENTIADSFSDVTILFADLVGFTELSSRTTPQELVKLLNCIFSDFDQLTEKYHLEKIKTIGDNYMVASGLPIADMALEMQEIMIKFNENKGESLHLRIGINSGSVVAGVIGTKKFIYDLWGDAVNTASRMESQGIPGKIQVTESTYQLLCQKYIFEPRGSIYVKGKGNMITYFLQGKK
jgi:adenylate cyclase